MPATLIRLTHSVQYSDFNAPDERCMAIRYDLLRRATFPDSPL